MPVKNYSYAHVPTVKQFNADLRFMTAIMGPFGSGKSSGCVMKLYERARAQVPGLDGVRRTRFAIVRNSYPQLRDTTIPTVMEWLEEFGDYHKSDYDFVLNRLSYDGHPIESWFHFRALDRPRDIRNLLSLELTGAWFNEVKEIPKRIVDTMRGRVGRYPSRNNGGATWSGIIMDTNPPDTDHWFYKLFEVDRPHYCPTCKDIQGGIVLFIDAKCPKCGTMDGEPFIQIYKQPSGRSDKAENINNLEVGYYARLCAGMDKDFIRVFADGEYGYVSDGKPVYPTFDEERHVSKVNLKAQTQYPLIISFDNTGRDQAAIICQYLPIGQLQVLHEFVMTDTSTKTLVREIVRPFVLSTYPGASLILTGDPAGVRLSDTDERNTFQEISEAFGVQATPARSNALNPRIGAVENLMRRFLGKDRFGLCVSPACPMIIKGFRGEYRMRRLQVVGHERYTDKPEKNLVSHCHDALQYASLLVEDPTSLMSDGSSGLWNSGPVLIDNSSGWAAFT